MFASSEIEPDIQGPHQLTCNRELNEMTIRYAFQTKDHEGWSTQYIGENEKYIYQRKKNVLQ